MESLKEELRQQGYKGIKLTTVNPFALKTGMFKAPVSRFPSLLPIVDAETVADRTIEGILKEESSFSVPGIGLFLHHFS